MRRIAVLIASLAFTPVLASAQQSLPGDSLEARVWLDRGDEPVVQRGDEVRVYYRTSHDAYVAIFRIDTDGVISLLFPQDPGVDTYVRGGRDYRLLFPLSARWRVNEDPGAGYFFMVASPEPLDLSLFGFDEREGWDLGTVGGTVYEDPYVAIDDYVAAVVPDWEYVPYALDFLQYDVGTAHSYPRFLCYDCHAYQSYSSWNPYRYSCSTYRVVIWDDPYFYPRYRYVGTRVVFARPFGPRPRYEFIDRGGSIGVAPIVRTREAPPRRVVEYKESPRAPAYQPRNPVPPRAATPRPLRSAPSQALPSRVAPPPRSAAPPRSSAAPRATAPGAARAVPAPSAPQRPSPGARGGTQTDERPTLQRRTPPSTRSGGRARPSSGVGATPGTTTRGTTSRGTTTRTVPSRSGRSPAVGTRGSTSRGTGAASPGRPSTGAGVRSSGGARPSVPARSAPARVSPRAGTGRSQPAGRPPAARSGRSGSSGSAGRRPPSSGRSGTGARSSSGGRGSSGSARPTRRSGSR